VDYFQVDPKPRKAPTALRLSFRKWWWLWIPSAIGLGFAQLIILTAWFFGASQLCGLDVFDRIPSPDGVHIAYVHEGSCGALGEYWAGVTILKKGQHLEEHSDRWVLYTEDSRTDDDNLLRSIKARWVGGALSVAYDERLEVSGRQADGLEVRYEPVAAADLDGVPIGRPSP